MSYVLDVCEEAVAAGERVSPLVIVARMKADHTPGDVGMYDLEQAQPQSVEEVAAIVRELAARPDYDLACYISQGLLSDTPVLPGETMAEAKVRARQTALPSEGKPVVMTVVYSKDREGVAMHPLDLENHRLERGSLDYPSPELGNTMEGRFSRTRH